MLLWALFDIIFEKRLFEAHFINRETGKPEPANFWFIIQYLGYYHGTLWGLFLLAFVMLFVVFAFACHHTQLVLTNVTTNERSKRSSLLRSIERRERRVKLGPSAGASSRSDGNSNEEDSSDDDEDTNGKHIVSTDSNGNAKEKEEEKGIDGKVVEGANGKVNNTNGELTNEDDMDKEVTKKAMKKLALPSRELFQSSIHLYNRGIIHNLMEMIRPPITSSHSSKPLLSFSSSTTSTAASSKGDRNNRKKRR